MAPARISSTAGSSFFQDVSTLRPNLLCIAQQGKGGVMDLEPYKAIVRQMPTETEQFGGQMFGESFMYLASKDLDIR